MWYTTHFELHSQATRLQDAPYHYHSCPDGSKTLFAKPRSEANFRQEKAMERHAYTQHLVEETPKIMRWASPRSLAVTSGILVSFFSSAY